MTCRVPNLQLHALAVKFDGADFEVDANGGDEGGSEGVFTEAQETAGFAYSGVADEEEFDLRQEWLAGCSARIGPASSPCDARALTYSPRSSSELSCSSSSSTRNAFSCPIRKVPGPRPNNITTPKQKTYKKVIIPTAGHLVEYESERSLISLEATGVLRNSTAALSSQVTSTAGPEKSLMCVSVGLRFKGCDRRRKVVEERGRCW